jgi:hypothetical protein
LFTAEGGCRFAGSDKAQKEEIGALGRAEAKSDKEMSELRAQFAREQEATKREIAALGRQLGEEAAARGKFAQEFGTLKAHLAEERPKWDKTSKENMREHESPAPPPSHRRTFRSLRTNPSREESQRAASLRTWRRQCAQQTCRRNHHEQRCRFQLRPLERR